MRAAFIKLTVKPRVIWSYIALHQHAPGSVLMVLPACDDVEPDLLASRSPPALRRVSEQRCLAVLKGKVDALVCHLSSLC